MKSLFSRLLDCFAEHVHCTCVADGYGCCYADEH